MIGSWRLREMLIQYCKLSLKLGLNRPFSFEDAKKVLKDKDEVIWNALSRMRKKGFLEVRRRKDNPQKKEYTLLKNEKDIVKYLADSNCK